jgi:hypothetical protein
MLGVVLRGAFGCLTCAAAPLPNAHRKPRAKQSRGNDDQLEAKLVEWTLLEYRGGFFEELYKGFAATIRQAIHFE